LKIDRLVDRINKKLEDKYPLEVSQGYRKGGIRTWKGRRILPIDQWLNMTARLENDKVVFDLSKGFSAFPDATSEVVFQYGTEGSEIYYEEIPKEQFDKWFNDYLDFLTFMKNTELGGMICNNCLLSPHKDRSGLLIGVHKMAAKLLNKEMKANEVLDINLEDREPYFEKINDDSVLYPCNVLNYFSCPYGCNGQSKRFEHELDSDVQYLFELNLVTRLVDLALLKASTMTQSNETIYEIDVRKNTIREVQTLHNGRQYCKVERSPIKKWLNKILKPSMVTVRNEEHVLEILKDNSKLDLVLRQFSTDEDYYEVRDRILSFFERSRENLKMHGYYKYTVYENKHKGTCLECGSNANVHYTNQDSWYCSSHYHLEQ